MGVIMNLALMVVVPEFIDLFKLGRGARLTVAIPNIIAAMAVARWTLVTRRPTLVEPLSAAVVALVAFDVSILVNAGGWPDQLLVGWSPVGVMMLMLVMLVPLTTRWALIAALSIIAMDPLGLAVHPVFFDQPWPPTALLAQRFFPRVIAVSYTHVLLPTVGTLLVRVVVLR